MEFQSYVRVWILIFFFKILYCTTDMGTWDAVASSDEKWYMYGVETKEAVEQYCSSLRYGNLIVLC